MIRSAVYLRARARAYCHLAAAAMALYIVPISPLLAGDGSDSTPTVTTSGLDVKGLTQVPGVIFARELKDVPGKNLVVVALQFPPASPQQSKSPPQSMGHRHPGSAYVYVIKGSVRLGLDGQPVQVVNAGQSFFEPVGAIHTVAENASDKEPASAIAVLIVPDGAPILTPTQAPKK